MSHTLSTGSRRRVVVEQRVQSPEFPSCGRVLRTRGAYAPHIPFSKGPDEEFSDSRSMSILPVLRAADVPLIVRRVGFEVVLSMTQALAVRAFWHPM